MPKRQDVVKEIVRTIRAREEITQASARREIRERIARTMSSGKYPLSIATGQIETVLEVMEMAYQRDRHTVLLPSEACELVESHLRARAAVLLREEGY
jgi:hypothetical protein